MSYKVYDRGRDQDLVALIAGILASSPVSRDDAVEEAEKIVEAVGTRALEARRCNHKSPCPQNYRASD